MRCVLVFLKVNGNSLQNQTSIQKIKINPGFHLKANQQDQKGALLKDKWIETNFKTR